MEQNDIDGFIFSYINITIHNIRSLGGPCRLNRRLSSGLLGLVTLMMTRGVSEGENAAPEGVMHPAYLFMKPGGRAWREGVVTAYPPSYRSTPARVEVKRKI